MLQLPLIAQLRAEGRAALADDLLAGTITAILLVPQGMAYALLAGLPPQMGLYASIVPPFVYALLGTSRALAVGPVAVAALMVASALSAYAGGDEARYLTGALILAAETGLVLLALGTLRLGALVAVISHPVLAGFTAGAAILIITSQLGHLAGIALPRGEGFETLHALTTRIGEAQPLTLAFSAAAIAGLLLAGGPLRRLMRGAGLGARAAAMTTRVAPLAIVIVATLVAATSGAAERGLAVVGTIPPGLPAPTLQFLVADGWLALAPSAVLIALVGYVESISVAKVLAARRRQKIDPDQELKALGITNLAAAVAGTMPVAGGFSRSVVNFEAGARTQLAAIVTSLWVALVALWFTEPFHDLPKAVLSAIIVVAVARLIDLRAALEIWRYDRHDGLTLLATALAVLALGIEAGLLVGVGLSLALYLRRTSRPHMAVLGRVPGTEHYRNVCRHKVETDPDILIIRVDESLYFANTGAVEEFILSRVHANPRVRHLVLACPAVNFIDASALEMLEHLEHDLRGAGVMLHLAEVKGPVMDRLLGTRLHAALAPDRIHLSVHHAVEALRAAAADGGTRESAR